MPLPSATIRRALVLALLLIPAAATRVLAQGASPFGVQEEFRFPAGRDSVSVPFENAAEHILIPVSVNGGPAFTMVFDTGMPSPGVLLYGGPAVDALQLPYGPARVRVGGAGGGGQAIEAQLATAITLRVGALEVAGSMAIVMPPTPQMSTLHDGIIGATLFRHLVVTIDHDRGVVTFWRPGRPAPPEAAASVPLELEGHGAYVTAGLVDEAGKVTPLKLILDLGATHSVSLNPRSDPAIRVPANARVSRIGRGMSGVLTGRIGRIPGLELGGRRFANVVATFPDSAFENPRGLDQRNGNLGGGVLGRFNVTLDYANARMFLVPNHRAEEPFEWDMSGVQFDPDERGAMVAQAVLPDSPGASAGIEPGEVLVAVDGRTAEPRSLMRDRERFRRPGRTIALTLRKGAHERTVKLKLRRLV